VIAMTGKAQASGNAIERLGKNVIGLRTWMSDETIFPFVCFGYGWDFNPSCSILDRVITIAEFGELNVTNLHNTKKTNRGSFYFQQHPMTAKEILVIMEDIAKRSVQYYFSKYKESNFK
jgi:type II restriction enzyme